MQTLADLKAENAEAEAAEVATPQVVEEVEEVEASEEETGELGEVAELDEEETEETKLEAWQISDEQTSQEDGKLFTGSDIKAAKTKLKAKLEKKNSENEELKARLAALESGQQAQPQSKLPLRPKREDFNFDDDAYDAAVDAWNDAKFDARLNQHSQNSNARAQQQQTVQAQEQSIDQHYERAATLIRDVGITEEVYQGADLKVRSAIEQVRPGQGDVVTDFLIANLGEGSEKLMYHLGVNSTALNGLQNALLTDQTGIKASLYLGRLMGEKAAPKKRVSRAPAPGKQLKGDVKAVPATEKGLKKEYEKAVKSDDMQARLSLRKKARSAGIDVSNW